MVIGVGFPALWSSTDFFRFDAKCVYSLTILSHLDIMPDCNWDCPHDQLSLDPRKKNTVFEITIDGDVFER